MATGRLVSPVKLLSLCAVLALLAPDDAPAQWSAPRALASSRVWAYVEVAVARDDSGTQAVAWRREETLEAALDGVEAATRNPGAPWSATAVLSATRRDGPASLHLGIDDRGEALLFWQNALPNRPGARPEVLSKPLGSRWSRPSPLARPGNGESEEQSIAVLPDGRAALVFERLGGIWLARRAADGRWQQARKIIAVHEGLFNKPQLLLERDGSLVLAWIRGRSHSAYVQSLVIGASGRRGRIRTLSPVNRAASELRLSGNGRGSALLAWRRSGPGFGLVEASVMGRKRRFERPVQLSAGTDRELVTAVDASGEATVLFTHVVGVRRADQLPQDAGEAPTRADVTAVQLVTHTPDGDWDRPRAVPSPPGESTLHPTVAASKDANRLLATWTQAPFSVSYSGGNQGWPTEAARDEASTRDSAGVWEAPTQISPLSSGPASIAIDRTGKATAAWIAYKSQSKPEPSFVTVEVAEYEPG
ncbi:MAG TPA: hypothetical protein VGD00_06100 [Solirubrobacteraceae bacterium]